ncbi:MAG: substrate-binding domain-containing protein [Rubrivivax sp.]
MHLHHATGSRRRGDREGKQGLVDRLGLLGHAPPTVARWPAVGDAAAERRRSGEFRIALCAPLRGPEGIWGPSCLASARLAQAELNRWSGIAGRPCELHIVDASEETSDIAATLLDLVDGGQVDALVGMCISSVRQRIVRAVGGRVPFVYTCLYEGGDHTPGLYAIGETAQRQLQPSIAWLSERAKATRWMLVGNDYVWPRVSHDIARRSIRAAGGQVVAETLLPFGAADYSQVVDTLRSTRADAVLISMVGQDAVDFNRAFARAGLQPHALRLSCAIEENQLLAIGADNTEGLYVAMGYFAALETEANLAFKARYHARYAERAPALNNLGQSLYEGMHFLAALLTDQRPGIPAQRSSARLADGPAAQAGESPIYLAQADGHAFRVIARF